MLSEFVSKTFKAITLPARTALSEGAQALEVIRTLPAELENFAVDFRMAQREAEKELQQMLNSVDSSFDRDVADMTSQERESAAYSELAKAEQFISQALFSLLKVARLAMAESSRVIEHEPAKKGRWKRLG
jgi:hypothetical protein